MLNQCILVGRVISINTEDKKPSITISIARNYKNDGEEEYRTDELDIELSDHLHATAMEYINTGSTLGIKASITGRVAQVGNKEIKFHAIVAEKLTFINSKKDS